MKKLTTSLFLVLSFSILSEAQPFKKALSGNVVLLQNQIEETNLTPTINDFRYIGNSDQIISSTSVLDAPRTIPALALLSSAIIPGSGQALNGKWGRAAAYFLVDVASVLYYVDRNNTAKRNERSYQDYADKKWSVTAYGQWLVEYSRVNELENGYDDSGGLEEQLFGKEPTWGNTPNDWDINIWETIREVEMKTPFIFNSPEGCLPTSCREASEFSHLLQSLGSQQYYELMSKYYQFQPGWQDFYLGDYTEGKGIYDPNHVYQYSWSSSMITPNFIEGRDRAYEFNNNYRQAGNILKLIMVNHIVSAFDAYFTVKLKNSKLEPSANLLSAETFSVTWHF